MFKVILTLFFLFQSLHAFLNTDNNYEKQLIALKNFDLPNTFLKDSIFISMKEDVEIYKTKHFLKTLENGDKFIPVLQKMMQEADVPAEFLYLAMTESSFDPYSSSSAKASGIWQFIPATAKRYGLVENTYIDERRDPIKSTEAAIAYLKRLHSMFGKWYLAALAYNCGEGTVSKAIAKAGSDDISVLLDENQKYLPKESRLYIRKILMMSVISNSTGFMLDNDSEYLLNRANNTTFIKVNVKNGTSLKDVSESIGIGSKELKAYNSHLKYTFTPPMGSQSYIYIPQDRQVAFSQNFDHTKEPEKYAIYTTKKGDALHKIAQHYGMSANALMELNHLKQAALKPNTTLVVPFGKAAPVSASENVSRERVYVVKMGDTLQTVAKKYDMSVATLLKANKKQNALVKAGERLVIPKN
ncbi:lytic transglycosylase domain-containing protein [Sulfurospirillum barnesii]|uniref:Soluble lytic murein transglycosylase-like protein n=1 Tax=Sulfurospirillum barnesii (strain ATCC 700032 / DSM 10660 / SES-3) TaxID=760154 RepID=I3XVP6_SULBS|nr:lytic transglycosylase domain-containing protein [Sulfurospirillum barnesii]AFL68020.1 soluble lytic murein transglycosylase-like protein [Sulfurospirillum barnesii SES-3]